MELRQLRTEVLGVILWVLSDSVASATTSGCGKVQVKDTRYQSSREGTYRASDQSCNGKTVYERNAGGDSNYIYFIQTVDGWRGWMIGSSSCTNKGGMAVEDEADTPDQVTEAWEEVWGGSWWYTSAKVVCAELSIGAIIGIVVGVLILASLIGLTIYCCCKSSSNKNRTRTNRTTASHTTRTAATTHITTVSQANPAFNYNSHQGTPGVPPPQMAWMGAPPTGPMAPPPYSSYAPPPAYPPANDPAYPPAPARLSMSPPPAYSEEGPK